MIRLHERQLAMLVLHFCLRYTIQCITRVQQGPRVHSREFTEVPQKFLYGYIEESPTYYDMLTVQELSLYHCQARALVPG